MSKSEIAKDKPNSVTDDLIVSRIQDVKFETIEVFGKRFMYCFIKMDNGFIQVGKPSVCVDDANFNQDDGQEISFENAKEELWKLEAYRMMSDNHAQSKD